MSRLTKVLLEGHGDAKIDAQVRLSAEDFDRIVTWIDLNGPYYPDYSTPYRDNLYGRSPLDPKQMQQLIGLTGLNLNDRKFLTYVDFTRPEWSPCLERFADKSDPKYREALSIIQSGKETLRKRPRTDMPGSALVCPTEIAQQAKYDARAKAESLMREAIVKGQKRYERP